MMISSKEGDMLVVNTDEELFNLFLAVETFQLLPKFMFTHNRQTEIVDRVKLFVS